MTRAGPIQTLKHDLQIIISEQIQDILVHQSFATTVGSEQA